MVTDSDHPPTGRRAHHVRANPGRTLGIALFGWFAVWAATSEALAESESSRLNAFFEEVHQAAIARWPEWQTSLGLKTDNTLWNDRSEDRRLAEHEITIRALARLRHAFDFDRLEPSAKLSYRLFERKSELDIEWFPFRHHGYLVDHLGGIHTWIPTFLINRHRVDTRADAEAYIARLRGVPKVIDQTIDRIRVRAEKGIIPPRFVFPRVLSDIDKVLTGSPFDATGTDTSILADFRKEMADLGLPDPDAAALVGQAITALETEVHPAYLRLRAEMAALASRATTDDGAWKFPDGAAYYALQLRSRTTTDLTADQIHAYGLEEVARIHDEMRAVAKDLGFTGDLSDFFGFMRTDPANYYPNTDAGRDAYLQDTRAIIERMDAALDAYFSLRPKAGLEVRRVEPYRESATDVAFYNRPALYGDRPGIYYLGMRDMALLPKYAMEGLAYHEAIPGHHMQIAIAQELEGLPEFRKQGGYTAYIEGWGLYAERLAKEMGFYRDAKSDFGRLSWELLRAARLVVDTGLHHKRWTREEAIAYLDANLPATHDTNVSAIERYIVWPGQATAYKIGMREILAARDEARRELGPGFDIRDFHRVVLEDGAVPLDILRELVRDWIAAGGG